MMSVGAGARSGTVHVELVNKIPLCSTGGFMTRGCVCTVHGIYIVHSFMLDCPRGEPLTIDGVGRLPSFD